MTRNLRHPRTPLKVNRLSDANEEFDPLIDVAPARYVVGIDLGTTNSAVSYVDTSQSPWQIRLLKLPQLVATNQVESRDTLPSFHFQMTGSDRAENLLQLPWTTPPRDWCVGVMARDEGQRLPENVVSSAKSWLCHTGVDRAAKLLPWHGAADVDRLSPVEASARFLGHIREAWDAQFPDDRLAEQDLVVTLPASFDEVARELTVEAAAMAGLPRIVLIEEPQAAFYAWVYKHDANWNELVAAGDTILVCDIGGGTSDFTLIKVRKAEDDDSAQGAQHGAQQVQFHRVAVGDHLILGGDNLDLALAHAIESKLSIKEKLSPRQWEVLVRSCRRVKETLLAQDGPDRATVNLPGSGSKLIGGGLQAEVTREEVEKLLVDGFLPKTKIEDMPVAGQSGFREFGLPFASDPAITRHLAAFLNAHGEVANRNPDSGAATGSDEESFRGAARPDVVLFNGGFFASPILRERLIEVLSSWFASSKPDDREDDGEKDGDWRPNLLDNDRLDLAVARGASYYGMVRRGEGVRIAANLARSYYVEVDSGAGQSQAICLVPGHAQPGQDIRLDDLKLEVTISQPVEFSLYVSSTRLTDQPGEIVMINREQMKPLPPMRTVLRTDRRNQTGSIPVTLNAHLSEIGTIDLWCQALTGDHRWRLQFDVRSATHTDQAAHQSSSESEGVVDEGVWQQCESVIASVFGDEATEKPNKLARRMVSTLKLERVDWPTSLLRRIWESLMDLKEGRRKSPSHETRWLNLLGFSLRPGYGLAVDDWRVAQTWRQVHGKLAHGGASQAESQILWRRIAGGLSAGQQTAIAEPILSSLRTAHSQSMTGKNVRGNVAIPMHEASEAWRLLGSLELLNVSVKVQIGKMIVDLMPKRKYEKVRNPMIWALGRIGQRQPAYGPLNTVVAQMEVESWLSGLLDLELQDSSQLAAMQLARHTGDRYRDVGAAAAEQTASWLKQTNAAQHLIELVTEGGTLAEEEQNQVFGEALPKGLRIG